MTLKTGRDFDEQLGIAMLSTEALEYRSRGWDRVAWLQLCCCRIDRERRGVNAGVDSDSARMQHLTALHRRQLQTIATFAFIHYHQS